MPLYEYHCKRCDKTFEVLQKFSDQPLATHEGCGGPVERLLSPPALQFKGTGWYITDYARKNGSSAGNGSSKSESVTESKPKTETKIESKPAASTSTKKD